MNLAGVSRGREKGRTEEKGRGVGEKKFVSNRVSSGGNGGCGVGDGDGVVVVSAVIVLFCVIFCGGDGGVLW